MPAQLITPDPITTILKTAFRYKWKIMFLPLLAISISVLIILFYPRRYISEARILVQVGR